MSIRQVCDICGKDESFSGTAFHNEPMTITVKNYNNEDIRISLHMEIDYEEDYKTKQHIQKEAEKKKFSCEEEFLEFLNSFKMKCDNCKICNKCKKDILYNFFKYKHMYRGENFLDFKEKTPVNTAKIKGFQKLIKQINKMPNDLINSSKDKKDYSKYSKYGFFEDDQENKFFSEKINSKGFGDLLQLIDTNDKGE